MDEDLLLKSQKNSSYMFENFSFQSTTDTTNLATIFKNIPMYTLESKSILIP